MIGLGITAVEIIYRVFFMDNELQDWCDACTYRKDKTAGFFSAKPYADAKQEIEALYKAAKQI